MGAGTRIIMSGLLCPYIEVPAIEHFWACALQTSGYTKQSTRRVIIKLKKVWTGDGAARELIKYMTKDILPDRSHVAPDVFGRVYEAVDGKRLTQPSAGFTSGLDSRFRCECGAVGSFQASSTPPEAAICGGVLDAQAGTTGATERE